MMSDVSQFDAQAVAADQLQRQWERGGVTVSRIRLADGSLRLSAPGQTAALVRSDGTVYDDTPNQ
jgi:hypothetical protein